MKNPNLIINDILEIINPLILSKNEQTLEIPIEFIFFHLLERTQQSIESLSFLTTKNITKHDHAIGLICRNLLSDFIISSYIDQFSTSKNDFSLAFSLLNSDLKKNDGLIKMYFENGFLSLDELNQYNERYIQDSTIESKTRNYCLKNNIKNFPPTKDIVKMFFDLKEKNIYSEEIKNSYNLWTLLSKYEHIGWSSYGFTRNTDEERIQKTILSTLKPTSLMIFICLSILDETEAINKFDKILQPYQNE